MKKDRKIKDNNYAHLRRRHAGLWAVPAGLAFPRTLRTILAGVGAESTGGARESYAIDAEVPGLALLLVLVV